MRKKLLALLCAPAICVTAVPTFAEEINSPIIQQRSIHIDNEESTYYEYSRAFDVLQSNGKNLNFYIVNNSTHYLTYKIKCNGIVVDSGLIMGGKNDTRLIKAHDANYEIILQAPSDGSRLNSLVRVRQYGR